MSPHDDAIARPRSRRVLRTAREVTDLRAGEFADILRAAQAGGEWAFGLLYRRHDPAIRRYLRARAGEAGDDLASQTWLDASRGIGRFAGTEDDFRGWMFTIARRRLIDHGRRRARRPEHPTDDQALGALAVDVDPAEGVVEGVAGDEAARLIADLLPGPQAEIVLLRVVAGLDVAEVAHITGRRPGTVRVMQHRALKRLARLLDDDDAGRV